MIAHGIVEKLIEIGRADSVNTPAVVARLKELECAHEPGCFDWRKWEPIIAPMATEELATLAKGLALAEERLVRWRGGSVAPVIPVWRELQRRNACLAESIGKWIAQHDPNPYAPSGSGGSRSHFLHALEVETAENANADLEQEVRKHWGDLEWLQHKAEWLQRELDTARERERLAQQEQARQDREKRLTSEVESLQRQVRLLGSFHRAEQRRRLVQKAEHLTEVERLKIVASKTEFPISSFPIQWATVEDATLRALSPEERASLVERLRDRKKGPWKQVFERLCADQVR